MGLCKISTWLTTDEAISDVVDVEKLSKVLFSDASGNPVTGSGGAKVSFDKARKSLSNFPTPAQSAEKRISDSTTYTLELNDGDKNEKSSSGSEKASRAKETGVVVLEKGEIEDAVMNV